MPRSFAPPHPRFALAAAVALACLSRPAAGQFNADAEHKLKSPVRDQVAQRDASGLGEFVIALPGDLKDFEVVEVQAYEPAQGGGRRSLTGTRYRDGKLERVPTGGPYGIVVSYKRGSNGAVWQLSVDPVFVGDLWVLAGQSNMEGVGKLVDVTPPHPKVMALGMDGKWVQAVEPLHWLDDSPDPIHSGDPATRARRSAELHASRKTGAGLGLPFGVAMANATNVPVGLVVCGHGGTNMAQWSPSKKGDGGMSLYGSMLRQGKLAGGKVKGVLWYQGESDTVDPKATAAYARAFAEFIPAVRADLGQPELPFYYVQIGRVAAAADPRPWNTVQEAQRRLAEVVPHTAVVAVIDLELEDVIHIGTHGLKRAGERLARIALRELFGQVGASAPTLDRVSAGADETLIVKFKGVNRSATDGRPILGPGVAQADGLKPDRHIGGFSIRGADGAEISLIYEAAVGPSREAVILKLTGKVPPGAFLWYGWGRDPYCNLTDALDMAVPVFGPIPLDGIK